MNELSQVILLTTLACAAMPLGAVVGVFDRVYPNWLDDEFRHSVIAFGGGVLLSAVSLVLVPDGIKHLSAAWVAIAFLSGGGTFLILDIFLARSQSSVAQMAAMLTDFVPEAIALGAAFALGEESGLVLALLIALQNLPEGFNAFRELQAGGRLKTITILIAFVLMVPLGPLSGAIGFLWLAGYPAAVGFIMLFAAGGILYLTFQDIAPQARVKNRMAPAFGAVVGFLLGLIGQSLFNH